MKKLFQKFLCGLIVAVSMLACFCSCSTPSDGTKDPEPLPPEVEFSTEFDLENGIVATDLTGLSIEDAYNNVSFLSKNPEKFVGTWFKAKGYVFGIADEKLSDLSDFSNMDESKIYIFPEISFPNEAGDKGANLYFTLPNAEERWSMNSDIYKKYFGKKILIEGKLEVVDFNDIKVACIRVSTIEFVEE